MKRNENKESRNMSAVKMNNEEEKRIIMKNGENSDLKETKIKRRKRFDDDINKSKKMKIKVWKES